MSSTSLNKMTLTRRTFNKDDSSKEFIRKAVVGSFIFHAAIFFIKFPEEKIHAPIKEKLGSIKMTYIKPIKKFEFEKKVEPVIEKPIAKEITKPTPPVEMASSNPVSKKVATSAGDPKQTKTQKVTQSKSGSAKNGPLSTPGTSNGTVGDSVKKGYEFKGKGLKALMGNSSTMSLAANVNTEGGSGLGSGGGKLNKGNNLTGDYRAPASMGDGSGLGGKDTVGNYDRSTTTKGLSNKKGIDTAFVQPEAVVMGSIDPEVLRKILGEYLAQFKFCYQQELQEQSEKIKGIVDLNFRIEGDGKVSMVKIKSATTKFSENGIGCMSKVLRMIDFPKPKGGGLVEVRQPLNFQAESTKI